MSNFSGRNKIISIIKSFFMPETWNKIQQVERDYSKLFKGVITISVASLIIFLVHRQIPQFNTYDLEYVDNEINKYIINTIKPIDYRPTFYLPSCLSQMIFNEIKSHPEIEYKREFIPTHDNGMISLDWVVKKNQSDTRPDKLLVILHGLTGGSESSYIKETAEIFSNQQDFKVVVVNYRGISGTPLLTPTFYHAGYTDDMYTAMKFIKLNYPELKCYTLGTSMGGNILTKLFASTDEFNDYVKGFVSVSNPLNCYEVEKRNRGKVLDFFLIQRQLGYVQKHHDVLKDTLDIHKLSMIKNYRDFDEIVTLKLFKFETVDDYYKESSCLHDIQHLKVPTIFFNSKNDKLSPVDTVDLETTFRKNPNIILVLTRWGGHVCWFEGTINPKRWFINKALNYVRALDEVEKLKTEGLLKFENIDSNNNLHFERENLV